MANVMHTGLWWRVIGAPEDRGNVWWHGFGNWTIKDVWQSGSRRNQAQRGYSRDHRPDCKQVNIALVVSRCGLPVGYEVFARNRHDAKTVQQIVEHVERIYGRSNRIWVIDRGMVSEDNVKYLHKGGRRYIVGTAKSQLRKYEQEVLAKDWKQVHEGLEVRLCPAPIRDEVFILCRSLERQVKEQSIHERFERRIEEGSVLTARNLAI
jgi:transposase